MGRTARLRYPWLTLAVLCLPALDLGAAPHPNNARAARTAALAAPMAALGTGSAAVIGNGTVQLGINPEGHLNGAGVGVRYVPTGYDATMPGCLCEGWGVADAASGVAGYADVYVGGVQNLSVVSFDVTADSATSVVDVAGKLRVTHRYHPSPQSNLYQVDVTIRNEDTAAGTGDIRYRRVIDWDVPPTAFDEYVTIEGSTLAPVRFASNNGFASPNPLAGPSDIGSTGDFANAGPADHGSLFDLGFGPLGPGASVQFTLYFGAAGSETAMRGALGALGIATFSLAKPSSDIRGTPNTFAFGVGRPSDLVAWWRLDGNGRDSSGNGLQAAIGTTAFEPGRINQAASFGHGHDRIESPWSPRFDTPRGVTVAAWVRPHRNDRTQTIVDRWDGSLKSTWSLGMEKGSWTWTTRIAGVDRTLRAPVRPFVRPDGFLPQGPWTHLAATWDGTEARLYVNGVLADHQATIGRFVQSNLSVVIGGRPNHLSFVGQIDDVRLYDFAFSSDDVLRVANEVWPNTKSAVNSDPWLSEHHAELRHLKPTVLALNFVTAVDTTPIGLASLYEAAALISDGSRYHGHKDLTAEAALDFNIIPINLTRAPKGTTCTYSGSATCQWQVPANHNSACYPRTSNDKFDYPELFSAHFAELYDQRDASGRALSLCELISTGRIQEVWIYGADVKCDPAYTGPHAQHDGKGLELAAFAPRYDDRRQRITPVEVAPCAGNGCLDDAQMDAIRAAPGCGDLSHSVRILWLQHGRSAASGVHSHGHGMEGLAGFHRKPEGGNPPIPYLNRYFTDFAGGNLGDAPYYVGGVHSWYDVCDADDSFPGARDPGPGCLSYQGTSSGAGEQAVSYKGPKHDGLLSPYVPACGNVHFPVNARNHYDYSNGQLVYSTCGDYRGGHGDNGRDKAELIGPALWIGPSHGDPEAGWMVYWRQNMPGLGNRLKDDDGKPMLPWLPFLYY